MAARMALDTGAEVADVAACAQTAPRRSATGRSADRVIVPLATDHPPRSEQHGRGTPLWSRPSVSLRE